MIRYATVVVATGVMVAIVVMLVGLVMGGPRQRATVGDLAHLTRLALTGQLGQWRRDSRFSLMDGVRQSRHGLTRADVDRWQDVYMGLLLRESPQTVVTIVRAGWTPADFDNLPFGLVTAPFLAEAVKTGLTVEDITAIIHTPNLNPAIATMIVGLAESRQEAMNWLTCPLASTPPVTGLHAIPVGKPLQETVREWKRALGADASWFAAAGLTLAEARNAARDPAGLDTAKMMAALRRTPTGSAYTR